MKVVLLFIMSISFANAQFSKNNTIYASGEVNIGNYVGVDLNLNYIYKNKYSFKIGYSGNIRNAKTKPNDYSSGFVGALFLGLANPYDQIENYQISAGKIYNLNGKGTIRANFLLGIGYTLIKEPENWERINGGFLGENYTWNYENHKTISLIINPKIEFPLTRLYGLTVSPMLQINKSRTYFGIGIGQMLGILKHKKKPLQ